MSPEQQAMMDWCEVGEFNPDQYEDKELRARYEDEAIRIQKQWDLEVV